MSASSLPTKDPPAATSPEPTAAPGMRSVKPVTVGELIQDELPPWA
jgi:hypothetical protein